MAYKREPQIILRTFLRANLTDPNSSRSGQWIYADAPRISDLGNASFPRVSIIKINESGEILGMFSNHIYHDVVLQVDVWSKKDRTYTLTVTDEALGTMASTVNTAATRLSYDFVPSTVTNIKHATVAYGTVTQRATDDNFTTPASLAAGTVEYSLSTGNLNFSADDVTGDDGEALTSTYTVVLEGEKCARHIARSIVKLVRNNWRTDSDMLGLLYPELLEMNSLPYDEPNGIYRYTISFRFKMHNIGEGTT